MANTVSGWVLSVWTDDDKKWLWAIRDSTGDMLAMCPNDGEDSELAAWEAGKRLILPALRPDVPPLYWILLGFLIGAAFVVLFT